MVLFLAVFSLDVVKKAFPALWHGVISVDCLAIFLYGYDVLSKRVLNFGDGGDGEVVASSNPFGDFRVSLA